MGVAPLFKPDADNSIQFSALGLFSAGFRSGLWLSGVLLAPCSCWFVGTTSRWLGSGRYLDPQILLMHLRIPH